MGTPPRRPRSRSRSRGRDERDSSAKTGGSHRRRSRSRSRDGGHRGRPGVDRPHSRSPRRRGDRDDNHHRSRSRDRSRRDRSRSRDRSRRDRSSSRGRDRGRSHSPPGRSSRWDRNGHGGGGGSALLLPPPPQQQYQPYQSGGGDRRRGGGGGPPVGSDEPPPVGSVQRGAVATVRPFGIFVALPGYRRQVLVHHSQVADDVRFARDDADEDKVKALEFLFERGTPVWVKVLFAEPDATGGFKVNGSMRVVDQSNGTDLDPTGQLATGRPGGGGGGPASDALPEEGSIHRGVVKRIEAYGVFVGLEGYRRQGLVHASQVSGYLDLSSEETAEDKKRALGEVVAVGDTVWVKVVEVTEDESGRPRISCSIKLVNQADGMDLDPGGARYRPRGAGASGAGRGAPIGADAGAIRGGAIDWGYMKADTKEYGRGGYDLLEDEPAAPAAAGPGPGAAGAAAGGGGSGSLPPAGRGRGATLPAWMTGGGPPAPGSGGGGLPGPPGGGAGGGISSIEEALAIIKAAAGGSSSKRHKKDKKRKHDKKDKHKSSKGSRHKEKSSRHRSSRSPSSDSSESGYSSDGGKRR